MGGAGIQWAVGERISRAGVLGSCRRRVRSGLSCLIRSNKDLVYI